MPRKLTATHEGQTFTRKTDRTYTHVVVVRNSLEKLQARAARYAEVSKAEFLRLQEIVNGTYQYMRYVEEPQLERAKLAVQSGREAYNLELARLAVLREAERFDPSWRVAGWCGRLDLAQKLSAKETNADWSCAAEVCIVRVNEA